MLVYRIAIALLLCSVAITSNAQSPTLTITKTGTGTGKIVSSPSGINCDETCTTASAAFPAGTSVTLTFTTYGPTTFSIINRWTGGGCDGTTISNGANSSCTVALTSNMNVSVTVTKYANTIIVLRQGTGHGALNVVSSVSGTSTPCTSFGTWCGHFEQAPFTATLTVTPDSQSAFAGWSGEGCSGTGSCVVAVNGNKFVTANFTSAATPPPVFPMTVNSTITPTTSTASANIQFRPQDVGLTASVYVFAVAPVGSVKLASDGSPPLFIGESVSFDGSKDSPSGCALAQLNPSGQLVGVSGSQLQAYTSGVLSSQGAAVTILNNTPTPAVAGATFYVGYGTTSTTMLTNGIYRNALTVPASTTCPLVSSQTALWWNPSESGWGLNLNHQGNILFGTLFDYDSSRAPLWLVMSNGAMASDGISFLGDLYRTTGPAFNANPFTPITSANLTKVGQMLVTFQDVNSGTLQYTVNGTPVTKGIQRQVYGSRAAACFPTTDSRVTATNYQDLWWNPNESGWGINITHQDNTLFATLFTYDATGKGLWLVMSAGTKQADGSYSGALYRTAGPAFDSNPFLPIGSGDVTTVGTMRLAFTDGNTGTLTYTYNGVQVTKAITRQVFSNTVPACN